MKHIIQWTTLASFLITCIQTTAFAQVQWTKDTNNPVMTGGEAGSWDRHVFNPRVLYNPDSSRFEMWYGGTSGFETNSGRPYRVGFATSPDGVTWTRYPEPVLEPDPGTWDARTVEGHTVLREEGTYKMWYTGTDPAITLIAIGYATSTDGITWTKYAGNPILTPDTTKWEMRGVADPFVRRTEDGSYQMWYSGFDGSDDAGGIASIGFANSQDGISWSKADSINPVLTVGPSTSWDNHIVAGPVVELDNDGMYHLWYSGLQVADLPRWIGYANSTDGMQWEKYNDPTTAFIYMNSDPVLFPGPNSWDYDMVEAPTVLKMDSTWHMWYAGRGRPFSTTFWGIGYATSVVGTVGVSIEEELFDKGYTLSQNFPNPFYSSTTIAYDLPEPAEVALKVYDVLGREIGVLASGKQAAGSHKTAFDATGHPPGVYYYRLSAGHFTVAKQMVVIR